MKLVSHLRDRRGTQGVTAKSFNDDITYRGPTMDRLESLGSTISNITLYDIKSMYNQVRFILPKATRVSSVRAAGCYTHASGYEIFTGKECSV